jgi:transcriptional regulator with XRE-family HTH domain
MRDNLRAVRLRVGRNVRYLRRLRGWSQERLAEQVGNGSKHVGQVERGEVNVTIDILTAMASAFGVQVGELFGSPPAATPGSRDHTISQRELEHVEQSLRIVARVKQERRRRARPAAD